MHNDKLHTMKAALLCSPRDVRLEERPIPVPGTGEALLQVVSAGVCGSDVHYYLEGRIGDQVIEKPIILGHEFAARVVALGEGAGGLEIGQLVAVEPGISCGQCEMCLQGNPNLCPQIRFCGTPPIDGIFAEYSVMPAANCFPLPEGLGAEDGAMLEPLGIAIHTIDLARLKPGNTAAVLGCGPIGLLSAAVARAAGASQIFMSEPLAYRRAFAECYVANRVFDPSAQDVTAEILRCTDGRGVDVVIEAAGVPSTPQQAIESACYGGKVILAGIPVEDHIEFKASIARRKGLTVKFVRRMKHTYPRAIQLVTGGQVDVRSLVTHCLPFSQVGEAMEMVAGYQDGVIKAMIQMA